MATEKDPFFRKVKFEDINEVSQEISGDHGEPEEGEWRYHREHRGEEDQRS